jgi:hypothetical protein
MAFLFLSDFIWLMPGAGCAVGHRLVSLSKSTEFTEL